MTPRRLSQRTSPATTAGSAASDRCARRGMRFVVLLGLATVAACGNPFPLEGRPCPCVAGYTCDAVDHVCVRGGGSRDGGPSRDGGDDCEATTCACRVATEAVDCGPHQYCDVAGGAHRCACVAGYTDTGQGCAWTGTIRDPAIGEPGTWTVANGALLSPTVPGAVDPGEATVIPSALCIMAHIQQTFEMPTFERAERLVLELSYKSTMDPAHPLGYALMGVSWGRGWVPLSYFNDRQFHAARICLAESAYAPAGTLGRGAPVTLSLGPYEPATDCPSTSVPEFAIDHAQIVTANPGECGARLGEGINFDAESTGGWTFSLASGASGGFAPGIGVGGSRAARVQAPCNVGASMSHSLDIVARNPALELFVGTTGGAASTIADAAIARGKFPIPLPPIGQAASIHVCLPPGLAGQTTDLGLSVLPTRFSERCTGVPDASIFADEVRVVEDPACQPSDTAADPGFEGTGAVFGAYGGYGDRVLDDGALGSTTRVRNTPGIAHGGTGYLAIESYGRCSTSGLILAPIVPASTGAAGPALILFSRVENAPDITTSIYTWGAHRILPKAAGWIKNTLCLNPLFVGRPQEVVINQYSGNPGAGHGCDTVGYGTQAALIDDLEVTTDPGCPAR